MKLLLDMPVRDDTGAELGIVDMVIFDPSSQELVGVVIAGGHQSRTIGLDKLKPGDGNELRSTVPADQFDLLPRFQEADYRVPGKGWQAPDPWIRARTRWPQGREDYPVGPEPERRASESARPLPSSRPGASTGVPHMRPDASRYPEREQTHVEDVLEPPTSVAKTPIERDDASNVNPQNLPAEPEQD